MSDLGDRVCQFLGICDQDEQPEEEPPRRRPAETEAEDDEPTRLRTSITRPTQTESEEEEEAESTRTRRAASTTTSSSSSSTSTSSPTSTSSSSTSTRMSTVTRSSASATSSASPSSSLESSDSASSVSNADEIASSSASPAAATDSSVSKGAIIGAVLGAVLGICLLISVVILWKRKRNRREPKAANWTDMSDSGRSNGAASPFVVQGQGQFQGPQDHSALDMQQNPYMDPILAPPPPLVAPAVPFGERDSEGFFSHTNSTVSSFGNAPPPQPPAPPHNSAVYGTPQMSRNSSSESTTTLTYNNSQADARRSSISMSGSYPTFSRSSSRESFLQAAELGGFLPVPPPAAAAAATSHQPSPAANRGVQLSDSAVPGRLASPFEQQETIDDDELAPPPPIRDVPESVSSAHTSRTFGSPAQGNTGGTPTAGQPEPEHDVDDDDDAYGGLYGAMITGTQTPPARQSFPRAPESAHPSPAHHTPLH